MRRLTAIELEPWTLPLIVLGLSAPVIAGFLLAGPALGVGLGTLAAVVLVVLAATARYDEEIEVASAADGRHRILVLALAAIGDPPAAKQVARVAGSGDGPGEAEVLVVAPAANRPLAHWLSDLRQARLDAQERLAVSVANLTAAGLRAEGRVGDSDPVQALEDALRSFAARDVVFAAPEGVGSAALEEVRRRLDRPVRRLVVGEGN